MSIPIIRLHVEGMKHSIITALTEYQAQMDEDVKKAVESYCTEENVSRVVREAAAAEIDKAIKDEIHHFFSYGEGRKIVRAAVQAGLSRTKLP